MTAPDVAGRTNDPGYEGFNDRGQQQCLGCWGWKFPVIHSCPGVPQAGRTPPPSLRRCQVSECYDDGSGVEECTHDATLRIFGHCECGPFVSLVCDHHNRVPSRCTVCQSLEITDSTEGLLS